MDPWIEKMLDGRAVGDVLVDELEISIRTYNCLKNLGIRTVGQLATMTEAELLRTQNFGRKSMKDLKDILGTFGVELGSTMVLNIEQQMNRAMARARAAKVAYASAVLEVQRIAKRMVDEDLEDMVAGAQGDGRISTDTSRC
jgi:hypothetical protein